MGFGRMMIHQLKRKEAQEARYNRQCGSLASCASWVYL
jgi:hypothetical protein